MSYPRRIPRLNPSGIVTDVPTWEVPEQHWTNGNNVVFRNNASERSPGYRSVYGTNLDEPLRLLHVPSGRPDNNVNDVWIYVGADSQNVVDDDSLHTDITIAGGLTNISTARFHSLFLFNGVPIHNNSADTPMSWDLNPANNFVVLPDWPAFIDRAYLLVPFKFYLIALNIESGSDFLTDFIVWSDSADPGTVPQSWTPGPDNDAGSSSIADNAGQLVAAEKLGESLLLYTEAGCYSLDYIGGNEIFSIRPRLPKLNAFFSGRSVLNVNNRHFVRTSNDIIAHDGNSVSSIVRGRYRREIFNSITNGFEGLSFLFFNEFQQEVWFCVSTTANPPNLAYVFHLNRNEWSRQELPENTSDIQMGVLNDSSVGGTRAHRIIAGETTPIGNTSLRLLDSTDSVSISSTLERHDLSFGDRERIKFVRGVHVLAENFADLEIRVGGRFNLDDAITWSGWLSITGQPTNVFAMGRYISFELRATTTDIWRVSGVDLEVEFRGYH